MLVSVSPAHAQNAGNKQVFRGENALIHANILTYLSEEQTVIATGNVEISQQGRIMLADELRYNKATGIVVATGNISILEPDGTVYFAQKAELKDELRQGVVDTFSARFTDNSLLAASSAVRHNENLTEMQRAVYSPCKVCEGYADDTPLWQIRAENVKIDTEEEKVTYRNAFFEFLDTPVLYTPYLSHATPGAKRKSGFLIPSYSTTNTLGVVVKAPYYWDIAPNMDATVTPIYTGLEGMAMAGTFRHLTPDGRYELSGSITNPEERDELGNRSGGREIRGHVEGKGRFNIDDSWGWGFDAKRASDDTYLQRYKFGYEDLLTSRAFIEQIDGNDYIGAETISFQGLNAQDDPDTTPLILPLATAHHETSPGWMGSWWHMDNNLLALARSEGVESRRVSTTVGWQLPYTTGNGHLLSLKTRLRGDGYDVANVPDPGNSGSTLDGVEGRIIPEVQLDWSWPIARQGTHTNIILEPTVQLIASPHGNNPKKIPNEDSQEIEISDMNLFSSNHFTGLDLVEGGPRTNYGMRGIISLIDYTDVNFLIGQHYRFKKQSEFTPESGLDEHFSDYVGRIGFLLYKDIIDLNYRFRLDKEDFDSRRSEVRSGFNFDPLQFNVGYLLLNEGTLANPVLDREEITADGRLRLTDFWSLTGNTRKDLSDNGGFINAGAGLVFENECLWVSMLFNRDFTSDRDIEPSESLTVQIRLKNLN